MEWMDSEKGHNERNAGFLHHIATYIEEDRRSAQYRDHTTRSRTSSQKVGMFVVLALFATSWWDTSMSVGAKENTRSFACILYKEESGAMVFAVIRYLIRTFRVRIIGYSADAMVRPFSKSPPPPSLNTSGHGLLRDCDATAFWSLRLIRCGIH
ncbi:hypothetical protein TNCV_4653861 [Trichonephila clavipes]|nr:hypothetical protein TNCV_4653861 [Trichonephila clavipes]